VRHSQVPPATPSYSSSGDKGKITAKKPTGIAPETLLAPTLGDSLKAATDGKGKVVALSLKDRSAVLPAGKKPDAVYWVDKEGRLVTSTYYRDRVHPWVDEINKSTLALSWLNTKWEKLRPDLDYAKYSGPDDAKGEDKGSFQGVSFPHPFDGGPKKLLSAYHGALANSPQGNDYLLEVTKRAIVAEKLGQRDEPDFLAVSFSSNDLVGHCWGPDSQEVLDLTLRSDLLIRDLLTFLDDKVGKGNYVIALSADHGICPLPEVARAQGKKAGRVIPKKFFAAAEERLNEKFPPKQVRANDEPARKGWIEASVSNMVYLNRALVADRGATVPQVSAELAKWLQEQPEVQAAFTHEQLVKGDMKSEVGRRVQRSFHPERSGDVTVVLQPYHFFSSQLTGTTHGSPHDYDTHVPLIIYGANVKPGVRKERVTPEAAAVILAEAIGVPAPAKAVVKVPANLWD
jgi:predicted AlkP superfamily pyrophosphatase or phosphodiesterase